MLEIVKVFSGNIISLEVPEKDRSGINTYIQLKDSFITADCSWDIKEMIPIIKGGTGLLTSLLANQVLGAKTGQDSESGETSAGD